MHLKLHRWQPDTIKQNRIILIIGRRGSGKSILLENLLYDIRKRFNFAVSCCPTVASNKMFQKHLPDAFVYQKGHDVNHLQKTLDAMDNEVRNNTQKQMLYVWDDTGFDKSIMSSKSMRELAQNGRQKNMTWISTVQYSKDVPPVIRSQVDYVICLRDNIINNRRKLYTDFCGIFPSFNEFNDVFTEVTRDYTALVFDQTSTENDITKTVFWYKAKENLPSFKIGNESFFWLSKRCVKTVDDENKNKKVVCCNDDEPKSSHNNNRHNNRHHNRHHSRHHSRRRDDDDDYKKFM